MTSTLIIQALLLFNGVSRKTIYKLYNKVLNFDDHDFLLSELKLIIGERGRDFNKSMLNQKIDLAKKTYDEAINKKIQIVSIFEDNYPMRFRLIDDPPVLIYVRGDLDRFNKGINVAIIGTREPTNHGIIVAERLGGNFASKGCNVVSGLALGCDASAHVGCLKANGGTLAVMPGGVDRIFPASNKKLGNEILDKGGALISEYPIGSSPFKGNYIDRDRLQSAFSECVIVVETDIKGGTMHTVKYTEEQKKILACYKHPEKYSNEEKVRGNNWMLFEKNAIPIKSDDDIDNLLIKLKIEKNKIFPKVLLLANERELRLLKLERDNMSQKARLNEEKDEQLAFGDLK